MSARRRPCNICGAPKTPGQGHKYCADCLIARREARRIRRRGVRGLMLLPRYGLTVEEYDALSGAQGGVCAICRRVPPSSRILRFSVDHNHDTGEVRGLLCQRCNMALHFVENADWRASAEAYLASPPAAILSDREQVSA